MSSLFTSESSGSPTKRIHHARAPNESGERPSPGESDQNAHHVDASGELPGRSGEACQRGVPAVAVPEDGDFFESA